MVALCLLHLMDKLSLTRVLWCDTEKRKSEILWRSKWNFIANEIGMGAVSINKVGEN